MGNPDYELVVRLLKVKIDLGDTFDSRDVCARFKSETGRLSEKNVRQVQQAISIASQNGEITKVESLQNDKRNGGNLFSWCALAVKAVKGCCPMCKRTLPIKPQKVINQSRRDGAALTKWLP